MDPATSTATVTQNIVVGSYNVNNDCSATMSLNSGETFNGVVADNGATVLFMQSNAGAGGAIGQLTRALNSCSSPSAFPQNFAFNFFGAQQGSTTTGGTTGH